MQKEINLEEILVEHCGCKTVEELKKNFFVNNISLAMFKEGAKEAVKQALELAAENAEVTGKTIIENYKEPPYMRRRLVTVVDKQSILRTINQVK